MPKLKFSNATFLVIFKHCAFCRIKSRLFKLVTKSYSNGTFSRHLSNTVLIKYHHHHWWIFFSQRVVQRPKACAERKKWLMWAGAWVGGIFLCCGFEPVAKFSQRRERFSLTSATRRAPLHISRTNFSRHPQHLSNFIIF